MTRLHLLYLANVLGLSQSIYNVTENPCEGKAFASVCNVMFDMKRDLDNTNIEMKDRFGEVKNMFTLLKSEKEDKSLVENEVNALSKIQSDGIKLVIKEMEKRVDTYSQLIKDKLQDTIKEVDVKTNNILKLSRKDIMKLRDQVLSQFKRNKVTYKNGVDHLESINHENKNVTTRIMKAQTLNLDNMFNKRILDLKRQYMKEASAIDRKVKPLITQNYQLIEEMKKKIEGIDDAIWAPGDYCILANGACPKGFLPAHGEMRAISMYSSNVTYIKEATFGASKITCHGKCGQFGNWIGDLTISACCK